MHAFYSLTLSLFCLVYADGKPGTTWLHDNFYKLQMFDVQKYAQLVSIGYLVNRICFNAATSVEKFGEVGADFLHLTMCVFGVIVGGFFGSLSQLTWIISLSTIFTSIKNLLALN